jgi:hypothetical protein
LQVYGSVNTSFLFNRSSRKKRFKLIKLSVWEPPTEHELEDANQVAAAEEAFSYPMGNGNGPKPKLWCVSTCYNNSILRNGSVKRRMPEVPQINPCPAADTGEMATPVYGTPIHSLWLYISTDAGNLNLNLALAD